MIEVILISKPTIDYDTLFRITYSILGRSITDICDKHSLTVKTFKSYIIELATFKDEDASISIIKQVNDYIKHLSFTFLVIATTKITYRLLEISGLKFTITETIKDGILSSIVSGDLESLIKIIRLCSHSNIESECRLFVNKIQEILESIGLNDLFANYEKKMNKDSTFILLEN